MLHSFLEMIGFYTDNAFPQPAGFWSTPLGFSITGLLLVQSIYKMYSRRIQTGVLATLWHCAMTLVMFCAFIGGLNPNYDPHHIVQTMLILMGLEAFGFLFNQVLHTIKERRNVKKNLR